MNLGQSYLRSIFAFGLFYLLTQITNAQPFPPLELTFSSAMGTKGSQVCLDVSVKNFTDIESFQFNISYNATLVRPLCPPAYEHPSIATGDNYVFYCGNSGSGYANLLWAGDPLTLSDGEIIFTLCFDIIGEPGNITPVYFNGLITVAEVYRQNDQGESFEIGLISNPGSIKIISNTMQVFANKCDVDENNPSSNTGSLTFYTVGGTPPYTYSVNGGAYTGTIQKDGDRIKINNITLGNYTIVITDANGLMVNKSINVSSNYLLTLDTPIVKDPTCQDRRNGTITIPSISGGLSPYEFQWSNFVSGSHDNPSVPLELTMLDAGKYYLTLTDGSGCSIQDSFELKVNPLITTVTVLDSATCSTSKNGRIRIEVSGGKPFVGTSGDEYEYRLNFGAWNRISPTAFISGLAAGDFKINIQDSNGCNTNDLTYNIPYKVDSLDFEIIEKRDVTCHGYTDGYLEIRALPIGSYAYGGDLPGINSSGKLIIQNITPGMGYKITAFDNNQCMGEIEVDILEPEILDVQATVVQPDCTNPGYIKIDHSGGTLPYVYNWDPAQGPNIDSIGNITGGTYSVTITDANNCPSAQRTFVMNQQGALSINASVNKEISCAGMNDAEIAVNINSTAGPFIIIWRNSTNSIISSSQTVTNVGPDTYTVIVKDNTGCESLPDTIVVEPKSALDVVADITNAKCSGDEGTISVTLNVNINDVTLEWREKGNSAILGSSPTFSGVAGDYILTIKGPGSCIKDEEYTILEGSAINFEFPQTQPVKCFGQNNGTAVIFNSPQNLKYYWSSGEEQAFLAINLSAGTNWVYAVDPNGCASDTIFFEVGTNPPLLLDTFATKLRNPSCFGYSDGFIEVSATGGSGTGYEYNWINISRSGSNIQNLSNGEFILEIIDSKDCLYSDTLYLSEPDSLVVFVDRNKSVELDCNNTDNGKIVLATTGGNPGIKTYVWETGLIADDEIASGLSAGTYCATVTDLKGCSAEICHTLTAATPLVGSLAPTPEPLCHNGTTCISVDNISGGTGNKYTFQINNGLIYPKDSCAIVQAGIYKVSMFDSAGCHIDTIITINQPEPILVDAGPDLTIQLGTTSNVINTFISSPTVINSIAWTPNEFIECITSDCQSVVFNPSKTTLYTVTAVDENGCLGKDDIEVTIKNIRHAYFSNIFTPNNDGNNDHFQIRVGVGVEIVKDFQIFDRWGNNVWHQSNYLPDPASTDGWDGKFKGVPVDPGVFVYIATVKFIDGVEIQYRGDVTIYNKSHN